jgi:hypothetical protein
MLFYRECLDFFESEVAELDSSGVVAAEIKSDEPLAMMSTEDEW